MVKSSTGLIALLSVIVSFQIHAEDLVIGFEAAEGYTNGLAPAAPWQFSPAEGYDMVITNAPVHSGSQSLAIRPVFYDKAIYPVMVPPGASAGFSVWIRTGEHTANYELLGAVGVRELDTYSEYWDRSVTVNFDNALGYNGDGGVTQFSLTCNGTRSGDFSPLSWYRVDCTITPNDIIFVTEIDTGAVTNTVPRYENYRIDQILLYGAYYSTDYFDDLSYTPPALPVTLTVQSDLGSPVPAVGSHTNDAGTEILCSVENVTGVYTQYACIGWTGTGAVPASGNSNSVNVALTENSSIAWNWQTNYWLDVTISGGGSVEVYEDFYAKDSEQVLTATPDAGWLFMGWYGNAAGTNDATITMDSPKSVLAVFSDDADGDGLLNSNETAIGSNPWKTDTDNDGFDDAFEVAQGMNVTNDSSAILSYIANHDTSFGLYPSNVVLNAAAGQMVLAVSGGEAQLNLQLEQSDDLITWTNAGGVIEWIQPVDGGKKFFRVRSEP